MNRFCRFLSPLGEISRIRPAGWMDREVKEGKATARCGRSGLIHQLPIRLWMTIKQNQISTSPHLTLTFQSAPYHSGANNVPLSIFQPITPDYSLRSLNPGRCPGLLSQRPYRASALQYIYKMIFQINLKKYNEIPFGIVTTKKWMVQNALYSPY